MTKKKHLVFIQGVHLDEKSWDAVKQNFNTDQYECSDLKRLGRDGQEPASLKEIARQAAEKIPTNAILVAHSYGGAIANALVGICPEKIQKIIYLAAVVPLRGEKPFDKLAPADQKAYGSAVDFQPPKIIPKDAKTFFKQTDPVVDLNSPLPHLYPEWISLTTEAIEYSDKDFNRIPKAYIHTLKDPVFSDTTQELFARRASIREITKGLPTGHFPMFSDPVTLAELIKALS